MFWILIIVIIWLTLLSGVVLIIRNHYKRLVDFGGKKNLEAILEKVLDRLEEDRISLAQVKKAIERIDREGEIYIQKVGLVRFNPFPDTGGDQSFVLALLDKGSNGIVISSLHSRSTTRWYAKNIVLGKGKDVELSKEEEKAIKEAGNINIKNKKG